MKIIGFEAADSIASKFNVVAKQDGDLVTFTAEIVGKGVVSVDLPYETVDKECIANLGFVLYVEHLTRLSALRAGQAAQC